jgi:predicted thioesterase
MPPMLGHVERLCVKALQPCLDEGGMTVGVGVNLRHVAAVPVGEVVDLSVETTAVTSRSLALKFKVHHDGRVPLRR